MKNGIHILSTKKLGAGQRELLANAGLKLEEADFISVTLLPVRIDRVKECLIFTSSNAVRSVLRHHNSNSLKDRPCFCVGSKTGALLEQNGFRVLVQKDYAAGLAAEITSSFADRSFTFFCGNLRRNNLPDAMSAANISFNEFTVYHTRLTPAGTDADVQGILFFSPSGIQSYLEKNTIGKKVCFCIGTTTAKALETITNHIVVAQEPTTESVIASAVAYFNHKNG
ncbi:uroporphyrinogen-III synthase [Sinomicrobium soli]|uniref:uroporphyrinogen-III synthase n=1 Tax=Sinomicrobium sp. N-1-3-6 TaxID=2219864 RepID=UPI000DCCB6F9|nr:uroporphyrinogen-III synthase [Sinomicrobium sp. N-1-3-6]RAV28339.1 uroporphyrinogen-III synthase [Sinomicrobium sp. N-1-3-6]